jgi:hypothetical protein
MWKQLVLLVVSMNFLAACSTVTYNPRRDIKVNKKWYGTTYKQGDNFVNPSDIAKKLGRKPQYKEKMKSFDNYYKLSQATGLLGGFAVGWSAGGGFDETGTLIGGLLLTAAAVYFDNKANDILVPLVEKRNALVYNYNMLDHKRMISKKDTRIMIPVYSYQW